ncbi:Hypothetical predicted protein, partial [Pelobates cultripes]
MGGRGGLTAERSRRHFPQLRRRSAQSAENHNISSPSNQTNISIHTQTSTG